MPHVHVLLVAPLGTGYMAQPGTDQHQGRVAVRESTHHTGAAADLPGEPLDHIVGSDPGPMLSREIEVGQRLLNAILYLLCGFFQLQLSKLLHHQSGLFSGCLLALLSTEHGLL